MNIKKLLVILYLVIWVFSAINPVWPFVWFIENLLIFLMLPVIFWVEKAYGFSPLSALFIFIFLVLHTLGAHYTYSEMPGLEIVTRLFDFQRNHYDRLVHFMFGFLIFLPLAETLMQTMPSKRVILLLTVFIIFSVSSLYEIFEWIAAVNVEPKAGFSVLGTQGDIWDAQKDMALAHLGVILSMLIWHKRVRVAVEN